MLYPKIKKLPVRFSFSLVICFFLSGCQSYFYNEFAVELDGIVEYGRSGFLADIQVGTVFDDNSQPITTPNAIEDIYDIQFAADDIAMAEAEAFTEEERSHNIANAPEEDETIN